MDRLIIEQLYQADPFCIERTGIWLLRLMHLENQILKIYSNTDHKTARGLKKWCHCVFWLQFHSIGNETKEEGHN